MHGKLLKFLSKIVCLLTFNIYKYHTPSWNVKHDDFALLSLAIEGGMGDCLPFALAFYGKLSLLPP